MRKRLLSAALAFTCALPACALAQSSVAISGFFSVGLEYINIGNGNPARGNTNEMRMVDNSSRIDFDVTEDLGGDLAAVGQDDIRIDLVTGYISASGEDYVGLRSKSWGELEMGRFDLHWFHTSDAIFPKGPLDARSVSILGYVSTGAAIAFDTRTPNAVRYTSPRWGPFDFLLAYSTDPYGSTGSMTSGPTDTTQEAYAWNFSPQLHGGNWMTGYSYWKAQAPAAAVTEPNQQADRVWGDYNWGRLEVGLAWDWSELTAAAGGATLAERNAWSIPFTYVIGPNATINGHYTVAQNDEVLGSGTGARMGAISYVYDLSKRTSLALTYARLNNDSRASYNLYTSDSVLGTSDAAVSAGEDPSILQLTVRHAF
jgi:predicted porin